MPVTQPVTARWAIVDETEGSRLVGAQLVANLTLQGHPSSVREARRAVGLFASDNGMNDDTVDAARLLVSETVTNALVHAGEHEVGLEMTLFPERLRVSVVDGAVIPLTRREACVDDEGGRGLALLDLVATTWGCDSLVGGKVVWFELAR